MNSLTLDGLRRERVLIVDEVRVVTATLEWRLEAQLGPVATWDHFVEDLTNRGRFVILALFRCHTIVRIPSHRERVMLATVYRSHDHRGSALLGVVTLSRCVLVMSCDHGSDVSPDSLFYYVRCFQV